MEKTLAREIYKRMEIGKPYTSMDLRKLLRAWDEGDDVTYTPDLYYRHIPAELHGKDVRKVIAAEMWKVVNAGYAKTYIKKESLPILRGLRYGAEPTCYQEYTIRYWVRVK